MIIFNKENATSFHESLQYHLDLHHTSENILNKSQVPSLYNNFISFLSHTLHNNLPHHHNWDMELLLNHYTQYIPLKLIHSLHYYFHYWDLTAIHHHYVFLQQQYYSVHPNSHVLNFHEQDHLKNKLV